MECYYSLLEVDQDASQEQIKKSYRKLALKWHPDKHGEATRDEADAKFKEIQQAFEVLSDPHERAFYDAHREEFLHGGFGKGGDEVPLFDVAPYTRNGRYDGYGDDEDGFYSVYRGVFDAITREEYESYKQCTGKTWQDEKIPSFGDSHSDYQSVVHKFYSWWSSFSTCRSFVSADNYDLREAPNRYVRKQMEYENRRLREVEKRKRNEEVRKLAAFVKKIDPRVAERKRLVAEKIRQVEARVQSRTAADRLAHQQRIEAAGYEDAFSEEQLEKALQEIESALDREQNGSDSASKQPKSSQQASGDAEQEESEEEEGFFCEACSKRFGSHNAFANHANSKKHKERVRFLKLAARGSDDEDEAEEEVQPEPVNMKRRENGKNAKQESTPISIPVAENGSSAADEISNEEKTNQEVADNAGNVEAAEGSNDKASVAQEQEQPQTYECKICSSSFTSRNKLFAHIKETGHASLKTVPMATGSRKQRTNDKNDKKKRSKAK